MTDPIPPPPGLQGFRHDEQADRWLHVQKLDTPFPCKAKGDECLLTADWVVIDAETGFASLACHEHMADLLWNLWHEEFRPATGGDG